MGGRAGGGAGMGSRSLGGYSSALARDMAKKYLGDFKDSEFKRGLAEGLAEFEKEFGIPANVTVTSKKLAPDIAAHIFRDSNKIEVNTLYEKRKPGHWQAKQTMMHELAHSIDSSLHMDTKSGAAKVHANTMSKVLHDKYVNFVADYYRPKATGGHYDAKSIGSYALTNKNEFFAEGVSLYMSGVKNSHTEGAFKLAKMMNIKL